MTREEAIKIIKDYKVNGCGYCHQGGDEVEEAFKMVIKALEQEPIKGEWIRVTDKSGKLVWECTNCKWQQRVTTNFCPNCGADMRGGNEC